ncbi:hypothetical protein VKS41_006265 [Umbelopsis sp. WA50703]
MGSHIPSIEQEAPHKQPRQTMPVNFFGPSVYSKFYKALICAVVLASPMLASAQQTSINNTACVQNYNAATDANTDYFPNKVDADDATYFQISYHNNYKLLVNSYTNETFALYQCGTPQPTGLANGTKFFPVPVSNVAVMETIVVPYLEMLGVANSVTAVGSDALISSPCFQKFVQSDNIPTLSDTNTTSANLTLTKVDVEFGAYEADPTNNKSVSVSASQDPGTLNRAEWLEFFAAFYNKEQLANTLTAQINDNYNRLKQAASGYNPKPLVAWASYTAPSSYNNNTASWTVSNATYKVQFSQDAGGSALSGGTYSSVSDFLNAITDVDVLIDETFVGSDFNAFLQNYNISATNENNYKFIKNKAVYREDRISTTAGGQDWLEAAIPMADAVLEDVINAINPSAPTSNYTRRWLRNIALNETIEYSSAVNCTSNENDARPDAAINFTSTAKFSQPTYGSSSSTSGAVSFTAVSSTLLVTVLATIFAFLQ